MRSTAAHDPMMSPPRPKGRGPFGDPCLLAASPFAWLASPGACEDGKDVEGIHSGRDSVSWLASPSASLEVLSPLESTMSCSLSSPPHNLTSNPAVSSPHGALHDFLGSTFSPSMFSPEPTAKPAATERRKVPMAGINSFSLFDHPDLSPMVLDSRLLGDSAGTTKNGDGRSTRRNHDSSTNNGVSSRSAWLEGYEERPKKQRTLIITPDHPRSPPGDAKRSRHGGIERATALVTPATESGNVSSRGVADAHGSRMGAYVGGKDFNLRKSAGKMDSILSVVKATMSMTSEENANKPKVACKCKKSRCLKLYCDCFAILNYCNPIYCKCTQCNNTEDHDDVRSEAIRITKERNSYAFKEKITDQETHVAGCHCKNSHCLKKYCECFTGAALCSANCKCQGCENYSGSSELARVRNLANNHGNVTPADPSSSSGAHGSLLVAHSGASSSSSSSSGGGSLLYSGSQSRKRKDSPNHAAWVSPPSLTPLAKASFAPPPLPTAAAAASKPAYSLRGSSRLPVDPQQDLPANGSAKRYSQRTTVASAKRSPSSAVKKVAFTLPSRTVSNESEHDDRAGYRSHRGTKREERGFRPDGNYHDARGDYDDDDEEDEDYDDDGEEDMDVEEEGSDDHDHARPEDSQRRQGALGKKAHGIADGAHPDLFAEAAPSSPPVTKYLEFQHKKRVEVFPFFGDQLPAIPKASFLQVLEHLSNREIYSSSLVNVLWSRAAFDDALWESNT